MSNPNLRDDVVARASAIIVYSIASSAGLVILAAGVWVGRLILR